MPWTSPPSSPPTPASRPPTARTRPRITPISSPPVQVGTRDRRSLTRGAWAVFPGSDRRASLAQARATREWVGMSRNDEPSSPIALPRNTWGGTAARAAPGLQRNKINNWGTALTYYAVLSIFPALLVLVSFVGLVANPARVTQILTDTVSQLGPKTAAKTFQGPIESITANRSAAGVMFALGILAALWAASGYVSAFADACNTIYEVEEGRPFWKRKPLQLLVTFVLIVLATLVAVALILTGPIVGALGGALGVGDTALNAWRFAKWPAMVLLVLIIFGVLYYTSPNARVSGVRWVTGGALLALIAWLVASVVFAIYAANF